jgi:hypothetical protein
MLVLAGRAHAGEARGAVVFPELGVASFTLDESSETQLGFRAASVSPNQMSPDFTLSAWLVPALVLTADLDLAFPIALGPDTRLVPRIGGSALLVGGGDIFGYALGPNAGVGLILNARGPVLLRADYTTRILGGTSLDESDAVVMNSVTVGIGW